MNVKPIITYTKWVASQKDFSKHVQGLKFPIEIDEDLYDWFLNLMWPKNWDQGKYFQVDEPVFSVGGKNTYMTFQKKKNKHYYLGECVSKGKKHKIFIQN